MTTATHPSHPLTLAYVQRVLKEREGLVKLISLIANMETASEFDATHNDEGMSGDDAVDSLSNLIEMARQVLAQAEKETP